MNIRAELSQRAFEDLQLKQQKRRRCDVRRAEQEKWGKGQKTEVSTF